MRKLVNYEDVQTQENTKGAIPFHTCLGASEIASLTVRFPMQVNMLHFGEDGRYTAHIITEAQEVPAKYKKVADGTHWCKIYDDEELMAEFRADKIEIYRAGGWNCLIRLIK